VVQARPISLNLQRLGDCPYLFVRKPRVAKVSEVREIVKTGLAYGNQ